MLRGFRVGNYKSFLADQELHFGPVLPDSEFDPLTVVAIYGANASGKSNFLEALRWASWIGTAGRSNRSRLGPGLRTPFKLDPEGLTAPSVAEFTLCIDRIEYQYGFAVDDERIVEEWLYSYPSRRKRMLFEREEDVTRFGPSVDGHREITKLMNQAREDRSVFGVLHSLKVPQLEPVRAWLAKFWALQPHDPIARRSSLPRRAFEGDPLLIELARKADLGIRDIEITERIVEPNEFELKEAESMEERLAELERVADSDADVDLEDEIERLQRSIRVRREPRVVCEPVFLHNDSRIPLKLSEQSDGTIAFITYMTRIVDLLDRGGVLVADEIEASVHPRLLARIIELFRDPGVNHTGAQLVFTTHDTSLLGTSLGEPIMRRDEVWFVEKNERGASELVPLSDFKPRKGENQERRYLGGAYGAVPDVDTGSLLEAFRKHRTEQRLW